MRFSGVNGHVCAARAKRKPGGSRHRALLFVAVVAVAGPAFGPADMLRIATFADESHPVISPAANFVAYAVVDGSDQANILARHATAFLWIAPAAGGAAKKIVEDHADTPVWSPDGSKLAFVRDR